MRAGRLRDLPARLAGPALLVTALALAGHLLFARLTAFEYGRDQGIYAAVAEAVARGAAPYRDAWDVKTPGVFFVYAGAGAVLGSGMSAVRWLEAVGFASIVVAFALFSRQHLGRSAPGLLGGALAACGHVWLGFWQTAQPESFAAVAVAWALVLASAEPGAAGAESRAWRRAACWFGTGIAWGVAGLLKPPLIAGAGVSLAVVAVRRRARGVAAALGPPSLALVGGMLLPVAAVVLYFSALGAWGDLVEVLFVYVPQHARLTLAAGPFADHLLRALGELAVRFSWANAMGLCLLLLLPPMHPRERAGLAHVAGILAIQLLGVALQAKFFPYHYGAALPLVALLAGWGFWKLIRAAPRRDLGAVAVGAIVVLLADGAGPGGVLQGGFGERLRMPGDGHHFNQQRRRVSAWIAGNTSPDAPFYVWGSEPVLHLLAERRPASRYVYNLPLRARWSRDAARPVLMAELAAKPPAVIVVQRRDVFPAVVGNLLDSAAALRGFPALRSLLRRRYAESLSTRDFTVYARTGE